MIYDSIFTIAVFCSRRSKKAPPCLGFKPLSFSLQPFPISLPRADAACLTRPLKEYRATSQRDCVYPWGRARRRNRRALLSRHRSSREADLFFPLARPAGAFQKILWSFGARIFGFWRGFGEGACPQRPVTELKRSQNPKRPLSNFIFTEWLQYFLNRSWTFPAEHRRAVSSAGLRVAGSHAHGVENPDPTFPSPHSGGNAHRVILAGWVNTRPARQSISP